MCCSLLEAFDRSVRLFSSLVRHLVMTQSRITIVGAGIIGLTTACTLLKEYSTHPELRLSIISERFSPETTGDISAGYWEPYGFESYDDRLLKWAMFTYEIFLSEFFSIKADRAGINKLSAYTLIGYQGDGRDKTFERPVYSESVRHFRMLEQNEMKMFQHLNPTEGFVFSTIAVEVKLYLKELRAFLAEDRRVTFVQKRIERLDELSEDADLVINCSGLGARQLANDPTVRPARGQVIPIVAPWIKSVFNFDTEEGNGYIIPQCHSVVLGGTFQLNDWNTNPDENDTKKILRMCSKCLPALAEIDGGHAQVGLRPYRDGGVRLEHQRISERLDVIHCYGHSGSGVTLSWGCAKEVVELVKTFIPGGSPPAGDRPEHELLWRLTPCLSSAL